MLLPQGSRLGPYEIIRLLGVGGMGEVYKATDSRLEREVAVKVLPELCFASGDRRQRFEREAKLLASLNHPSIAGIHAFEAWEGRHLLVMEYVKGDTLEARMAAGRLPLAEALPLALQIAEALEAAHDQGIVHRDLKPANVMVTPQGRVKLLDFGLARQMEPSEPGGPGPAPTRSMLTNPGTVLGTVAYMSPEQALGSHVDYRSDQFSFGSLFYELLTGTRAFWRGNPPETLTAILREEPEPIEKAAPMAPLEVRWILRKCLAKKPEDRYASTRDLTLDLRGRPGATWRESLSAPTEAAVLRPASVAVLPFVNMSADPENEFFADGITEDVIAHLARIKTLHVISRTSVMFYKGRQQALKEIGAALNADVLVEGSVRRLGQRVRIVAQLVDPRTDLHLWSATYDRDLEDVFAIQTDVAMQIAAALKVEITLDESERIRQRPTRDLEAYQLYLQGRYELVKFSPDGTIKSLALFERAVAQDPAFALAYVGMAHAHMQFGIEGLSGAMPLEAYARGQKAVDRALALDGDLAEAHGILGLLLFIRDYQWARAEAELRLAIKLSPSGPDAFDHLGWLCSAQERFEEALALVSRARELDPIAHRSDVGNELMRMGRYQEALAETERALTLDPSFPRSHAVHGWACLALEKRQEGLASLARAVELTPGSTLFLAQLGQACGMTGATDRARAILADLEALARTKLVAPYHFAHIHTGLGDLETAFAYLEKAFELRSGGVYGIRGSYLFRTLRGHPRFQKLLKQMNHLI